MRSEKRRGNKRKNGVRLILLSLLLIPFFSYLYIISVHSSGLIKLPISILIVWLDVISLFILLFGIVLVISNKKDNNYKKMRLWKKIIITIFFIGYIGCSSTLMFLFYGPYNEFRDWYVTSAMTTLSHQFLAKWIYDDETIERIRYENDVIEVAEDTNPDLVVINGGDVTISVYANEYEEQVLKKDKGNDLYKIIDIKEKNFKGKMAVIYDPSKVHIAVSNGIGSDVNTATGQMIYTMEKQSGSVISMNASGFYDPGYNSKGGVPRGCVISNGKKIINNAGYKFSVGGLIGFNKDNKLVLSRTMTCDQAINSGIRDAIQYGPFLIVNGKSSYVKGNGGWGTAPRSAIAQRKDGIVLFLVIDGRQKESLGADMGDLSSVLLKYGAYNAANLDGGTSSAMSVNGSIITHPINGSFQPKTRIVPDAWVVYK